MNNRKGSVVIIFGIIMIIFLSIGVAWYAESQKSVMSPIKDGQGEIFPVASTSIVQPVATSTPFSFSCPENSTETLIAYEDKVMGIAFCYPSDLTVTTNTITWPAISNTSTPQISFWILNKVSKSNIFGHLATCDSSGAHGEYWCIPPAPSQTIEDKNPNGLNYVLFRHNIDYSASGEGYGTTTVYTSNAGPSAYLLLADQKYLAFAIVNSLYQAQGFGSLPSYVDQDLLKILNTVTIIPQ